MAGITLTTSPGFGTVGDLPDKIAAAGHELVRLVDDGPSVGAALLAATDFVSLHVAGGPDSGNLIDSRALGAMKPKVSLINFGRGTVVDLDALADALNTGHPSGAALDACPVGHRTMRDRHDLTTRNQEVARR